MNLDDTASHRPQSDDESVWEIEYRLWRLGEDLRSLALAVMRHRLRQRGEVQMPPVLRPSNPDRPTRWPIRRPMWGGRL